ncbi:MAG: FtsX-like permease family protein [Candidatus Bathyarchaeota archaeon]|nr:ABC transporter permease [Candidatus Bathyarchaeota archaeon A05DMB-3]MDH7607628.1 FtsX-like permease family protein [Candidatus Bathyarchaeota archaeon]
MGVLTRAVRNVSRRKMRTFLVIIALSLSMAIMISIPAGIMANQKAAQSIIENYNNTITSMQEEINKTSTLIEISASSRRGMFFGTPSGMPFPGFGQEEAFINATVVDEISTIEGVKDIVPFLEVSSEETTEDTMSTPRGSFTISRPVYTITGVCLKSTLIDNYSILPTNVIDGRNLIEGDSGVIGISLNLSDYYSVYVGDKLKVYGETFKVVGIYNSTARTVYMNITDAQRITNNIGNVTRLDVYAQGISYVNSIADVIEAAYPELYVTTYEDRLANLERTQAMYETTLENAESTISQTQAVAFQEILIAIVATSLIVLFMMLYTVRERTKEIGILKAIGFSNWNVMIQFILEGILLSAMAGGVGALIGIVGAPVISSLLLPSVNPFSAQQPGFPRQNINFGTALSQSVTVTPDLQTLLLAFGVFLLLGALGSLYPAWRAARTSPMEALRYE